MLHLALVASGRVASPPSRTTKCCTERCLFPPHHLQRMDFALLPRVGQTSPSRACLLAGRGSTCRLAFLVSECCVHHPGGCQGGGENQALSYSSPSLLMSNHDVLSPLIQEEESVWVTHPQDPALLKRSTRVYQRCGVPSYPHACHCPSSPLTFMF